MGNKVIQARRGLDDVEGKTPAGEASARYLQS